MHTCLFYNSLHYFHSAKYLQVLVACDALRDDVLPPLGIRLEDQQVPCLPSRDPVSLQQFCSMFPLLDAVGNDSTQGAPAIWKLEDPAALEQVCPRSFSLPFAGFCWPASAL